MVAKRGLRFDVEFRLNLTSQDAMNAPKITNNQLLQILRAYWEWRWLWITTTATFAALGLFYVIFLKNDQWVASQGLIVRDEANGGVMRLGRFESQTAMKTAQETVLEMAKNPQVLDDALQVVGREPTWFGFWQSNKQPTTGEIEDLARNGIEVRAPRGAELGTTEVIYLDVTQNSPERAGALVNAVSDALEHRMQLVRESRAAGVTTELQISVETARRNLDETTAKLKVMEARAGADLSDLRGLTDTNSGGSTNRTQLDSIKAELRSAELQHQQVKIDLALAEESFADPDQLLVAPSSLINSHAGLRKLREGLADATIASSQLRGRYTSVHPRVIAAVEAEAKLRDQLRIELGRSVESLRKDLEITTERIAKLSKQQTQLESRLGNLAEIRAEYANLASEVRSRNQLLQDAERELAQAIASREAAKTSSLITRLDAPLIGENPIGPGRTTILAGATVCGFLFGIGIVFLLSPQGGQAGFGRRKFDYAGLAGRRAADRVQVPGATTPAVSSVLAPQEDRRRAPRPAGSQDFGTETSSSHLLNRTDADSLPAGQSTFAVTATMAAAERPSVATDVERQTTAETSPSAEPLTDEPAAAPMDPRALAKKFQLRSNGAVTSLDAIANAPPVPRTQATVSESGSADDEPAKPDVIETGKDGGQADTKSMAAAQAVIAQALQCSASSLPSSLQNH